MNFVTRRNKNNTPFKLYSLMPMIQPKRIEVSKPLTSIESIPQPKVKEMLWGEPTWFLFHTLAEKIKEEYFHQLKDALFKYVRQICNNLPCPDCARHATQYMNRINFDAITTKEQFKIMLFSFHNEVNKQKNYPLFDFSELTTKYETAITINIVRNFFNHFSKKSFNIRIDTGNYNRSRLLTEFRKWLEQNANCFYE